MIGERSEVDVARAAGELLEWTRVVRPEGLPDVVSALGALGEPSLAPAIAALADHHDPEVRLVVAQALGGLPDSSPLTVGALVVLSCDDVEEVRSWATFGLGTDRLNRSPGVDDALLARLADPSEEVRVEAARGLARLDGLTAP
ncbi:MAG TPA: HEAT repeat domain-containing protein [Solirubrobacteraceae bacterium]